jgi:predicted nucleic acid-binding protein
LIVVDASLVIELSLATQDGWRIRARLREAGDILAAPELIDMEVLQVLRRFTRGEAIDSGQALDAIDLFEALPMERFSHAPLRGRIWSLRENLTAYDAAYVSLAEMLDAPLWTRDAKLLSVPGRTARVEVV